MNKPRIAMVASVGIGDGVVYLIVAENLIRNGFEITLYSNPISGLQAWLPQMTVKPYPKLEECEEEFANYDLVLADGISIIGRPHYTEDQFPELARKYVYLGLGKVDKKLRFDHAKRLQEKLSRETFEKIKKLASCTGEIRFQDGRRNTTMVQNAVMFCEKVLDLKDCVYSSGFTPPPEMNLIKTRYDKRVLIHPFSSNVDKNWPLGKFFKLALKLKASGWDPVFSMSPREREELFLPYSDGQFEAPIFQSLSDFAAYIYESRAMIGNDSGSVNLASSLGVPTVTISRKGKDHRWRPDWCEGTVVAPLLRLKSPVSSKRVWKPFVPVNLVYRSFRKLIQLSSH